MLSEYQATLHKRGEGQPMEGGQDIGWVNIVVLEAGRAGPLSLIGHQGPHP